MKKTVCPLCGNYESKIKIFSKKKYDVLACKTCELFFIHPYEEDVYKKVSTYDYDNLEILEPGRHYASPNPYFKKYLPYIKNECKGAKTILDVGCGTGQFLELLGKSCPTIRRVGIELNVDRFEFAKKVANCEIYQIPIEKFEYNYKFDIITMFNVLSHIPSFDNLFSSIDRLLSDDGKLLLKVGEMTIDVRRDAVFDWGIPDHLHFLGMKTMHYICDKYDFELIKHERSPLAEDLFTYNRWTRPGRSNTRNIIKRTVANTPFALSILRRLYNIRHGNTIFSSFIVIRPKNP